MHVVPKAVQDSQSRPSSKFAATNRLLREDGFDRVVRAESISDRHFKIFFVSNNRDNARLGIIVGKKTISDATDRNRIKRVVRETFRQHIIKQCKLDLVVMVKHADLQEGSTQARNLKILFSRLEDRCVE